jgi:hypothetical protein
MKENLSNSFSPRKVKKNKQTKKTKSGYGSIG